jgi:hypothetical protein
MKKSDTRDFPEGTLRIKAKHLEPVIKTKKGWKQTDYNTKNIQRIAHLYKSHANFNMLLDSKDKTFLKGFLTPKNEIRGERTGHLPDGQRLDKAFSIFSPHLTIHDETNNTHWDVMFQNPNGNYAHLYTLEKVKEGKTKKFKKVKDFEKKLPNLKKKLNNAIRKDDPMALPLYTLLKTKMRVGNKYSYNTLGHKGLTTLTKDNVKIKDNNVTFTFPGKDGVPQKITKKFPKSYIKLLSNKIKLLKVNEFIFTDKNGNPLRDTMFEDAFLKYCGTKFYPHIVRSAYATQAAENFLKQNKKPQKEEVKQLYSTIAETLGHKKFSKKDNKWKVSYTVTISHYIQPELVEKINAVVC